MLDDDPLAPVHVEVAGLLRLLAGHPDAVRVRDGIGEVLVPHLARQEEFHVHGLGEGERMGVVQQDRHRIAVRHGLLTGAQGEEVL